jgi:hypothetical protein
MQGFILASIWQRAVLLLHVNQFSSCLLITSQIWFSEMDQIKLNLLCTHTTWIHLLKSHEHELSSSHKNYIFKSIN